MTAGSGDTLFSRPAFGPSAAGRVPEPWPTGRRRRPKPVAPTLPARPVYVRAARRPQAVPFDPSAPRPRVVDDSSLLGLSRLSRGRIGSRLFTWFFVFVFATIAVQLVASLLNP